MFTTIEPPKKKLAHTGTYWEWKVCGCTNPARTLFVLEVEKGWFSMDMYIGGHTE